MAADAYWTTLDLKSVGAALAVIGGVAFPFIRDLYKEWRAGRSLENQSLAKVAETAADRQERIYREQYANIEKERDYFAEQTRQKDTIVLAKEAETSDRRREGRAMEDWAHFYRHGWLNCQMKVDRMGAFMGRWHRSEIAPERVHEVLAQLDRETAPRIPEVPLLQDAFAEKPPR